MTVTSVTLTEWEVVWPLWLRLWLTELLAGLASVSLQCCGLKLAGDDRGFLCSAEVCEGLQVDWTDEGLD